MSASKNLDCPETKLSRSEKPCHWGARVGLITNGDDGLLSSVAFFPTATMNSLQQIDSHAGDVKSRAGDATSSSMERRLVRLMQGTISATMHETHRHIGRVWAKTISRLTVTKMKWTRRIVNVLWRLQCSRQCFPTVNVVEWNSSRFVLIIEEKGDF